MAQPAAFTGGAAAVTVEAEVTAMPRGPQNLELEVLRNGRREDTFAATADLADPAALKAELVKWLTGKKWHQNRWLEFELLARPAGTWDKPVKVRT